MFVQHEHHATVKTSQPQAMLCHLPTMAAATRAYYYASKRHMKSTLNYRSSLELPTSFECAELSQKVLTIGAIHVINNKVCQLLIRKQSNWDMFTFAHLLFQDRRGFDSEQQQVM